MKFNKQNFKGVIKGGLVSLLALSLTNCIFDGDEDKDPPLVVSSSSVADSTSSATDSTSSSVVATSSSSTGSTSNILSGHIASDMTLDASIVYEISGYAYIDSGATLNIPAGTMIKSEGQSALFVMPGAKINAVGTASNPIVFTSKSATPATGDWAGVLIFGQAPVSTATKTQAFEAQSAENESFGGTNEADSSGVFKYVRIEYAGFVVGPDKELNGLTLGGVGSKTDIQYVQVHKGKDDAFEWFGGNVNTKYLIATAQQDDGFDIDEGYQGTSQYMIQIQDENSDRGIEAGSKAADPARITNASWSNVTIVANKKNQAIHIKDNVALAIDKIVVQSDSAANIVKIEGTTSIAKVTDSTTKFTNAFWAGTTAGDAVSATDGTVDKTAEVAAMWTKVTTALNADLTPAAANIISAGAGAIVGTKWYEGWAVGVSTEPVSLDPVLTGHINEDLTLDAAVEYELKGYVYIDSGYTLTIPAGTMFKSEGQSALFVMPGAKINAVGTASNPIVFTSKSATPATGDWAGVLIFGQAPVSTSTKTQDFEAQSAEGESFGGADEADSSGVFKYVRIEYAGFVVGPDKELNGLTLGGVGSKTVIEYVQVHKGKDDAFEWFGGSVNTKYLIATAQQDDGFDIDEGYQGTSQYMIQIQDENSDRGIEAGSKAADPARITNASWSNVTIVANKKNQAIHIKDNVALAIDKILVQADSSANIVKIEGTTSISKVTDSTTKFTNAFWAGVTAGDAVSATDGTVDKTAEVAAMWTKVSAVVNADLSPVGAEVIASGAGAIGSEGLWYQGWSTGVSAVPATLDPVLTGHINQDITLDAAIEYELKGYVYIDSGYTLTIPAGTMIKSEGQSALFVMPGAKINAVGTASNPIVFTSKSATPTTGDWAGVLIFGQAPVSTSTKTQDFEAQSAEGESFGGADEADSSGVFKYVRIEYAGFVVGPDKELNGLTLGGVGSKTVIEYVQVHKGKDDAFEWFGGNAVTNYLVATAQQDDGFDIDEGYQGTAQYLLQVQDENSDRGIEAGSKAADPARITNASWSNVTIVANKKNQAIHIKDNVALAIDKLAIEVDSAANVIKIEGTTSIAKVTDSTTQFTNAFWSGTTVGDAVSATDGTVDKTAEVAAMFTEVTDVLDTDYSTLDSAAVAAGAGALMSGNLWTAGWTTGL